MPNDKLLMTTASLMLVAGGLLILSGHLANRKHEAKIIKLKAERDATHKKFMQDFDAINETLDKRLETARFWSIVTRDM